MEKEQRESRSGEKFTEELANLGIELNEHQKEQFDQYYELLVEWNKVMNLTGITEYEEVNLKHFTDSLSIARVKDMHQVQSVIDIGTGAGWDWKKSVQFMEEQKILQRKRNTENVLICVYREQWQILRH